MTRPTLPARRPLAIVVAMLIAVAGITSALAQALGPAAPSPAEDGAAVIAHAVVDVDADESVWRARVVEVTNETPSFEAIAPVFVIADDIPIIAEDERSSLRQRVASGEAAVVAAGSATTLTSTGPPETATLIDLVPADEANDNGQVEDAVLSEPFTLDPGSYDVDVIRIVLEEGSSSAIQAGNGPSFVVGERGQVVVESTNEQWLVTGDGERTVDGALTISAPNGGASVLVLRIGPAVEGRAPAATPATPDATPATPVGTPEPEETPEPSPTSEITDASDLLVPATIEDAPETPTATATSDEPQDIDSDGDGLDNSDEIALGTDPDVPDTDEDGLSDADEILRGSDPLVADTDEDGIDDGAEVDLGTDPLNLDTDGDVLYDGGELIYGTDPLGVDTDGDGLTDGDEVYFVGTDPTVVDTDGDGFTDLEEVNAGTDPLDAASFP